MDVSLDHTMIRVKDLETTLSWYKNNFSYVEYGRREAETFTNVYLAPPEKPQKGGMLELTYNNDGRAYSEGDAWGHIAVRVDDVHDAYYRLMDMGVNDYRDPESCGGRYAFIKDPDGHEIELIERQNGEQWSLDHTMVRVGNVDEAIGWWGRKMGFDIVGRREADTFANYYLKPAKMSEAGMALELTYNYGQDDYSLGDSWGHLAVRCEDLETFWNTLMERGAEDYRNPSSCNNEYAFTKDGFGREVEILER